MFWKLGKVFGCVFWTFEPVFCVDNVLYCLQVSKSFWKCVWAFAHEGWKKSNSFWKSGNVVGHCLNLWLEFWKVVGVTFEAFWQFDDVFRKVFFRKVGRVFGTCFEDVVKCLEKCLESVCKFGDLLGKALETFCWQFGQVFGNAVRTFLKVWSFVGSMCWKRVGKLG